MKQGRERMYIRRQTIKKSGTVYIYEVEGFWDPERHIARSHRRLIGREDPATGEVVPTGIPGRPGASAEQTDSMAGTDASEPLEGEQEDLEQRRSDAARFRQDGETIKELQLEVSRLELQVKMLKPGLDVLGKRLQKCAGRIDAALNGT